MLNYYPLFIALAGFVLSAVLSQRALSLMQPDAKVALVDASASTRLLSIVVAAVFVGLIIWRPVAAWAFLGVAYICLAVRSILRVQKLDLPVPISRLLHTANLTACVGMVVCACIFELRVAGSSTNAPTSLSPSSAAKSDVVVTVDGARHACVVALHSEAQGSIISCDDVVTFLRDELRLPSGSSYDIRTIPDVPAAQLAKVEASLKGAGYRHSGAP